MKALLNNTYARVGVLVVVLCLNLNVASAQQQQWASQYVAWSFDESIGDVYNIDQHVWIVQPITDSFWPLQWSWRDAGGVGGYMGLQQGRNGSQNVRFSLWDATEAQGAECRTFGGEGVGYTCVLPVSIDPNKWYRLRLWRTEAAADGQWWGGWLSETDANGAETEHFIGQIKVSRAFSAVEPASITNFVEYYGSAVERCDQVPLSVVGFAPPAVNYQGNDAGVYGGYASYQGSSRSPGNSCEEGREAQGAFVSATPYDFGNAQGVMMYLGGTQQEHMSDPTASSTATDEVSEEPPVLEEELPVSEEEPPVSEEEEPPVSGEEATDLQGGGVLAPGQNLPDLIAYSFTASESTTIIGESSVPNTGYLCTQQVKEEDQIGPLALLGVVEQGGCWLNEEYSNRNYTVERGVIVGANNQPGFDAFRIHEPTHKATEFEAGKHVVAYKFPTREAYTVYRFDGSAITTVLDVPAAQADPSAFVTLEGLPAYTIKGTETYLFVPSSRRISVFTELAPGIEGARVAGTTLLDAYKYRYAIQGEVHDTGEDFKAGPDTHENVYSQTRQFFLIQDRAGRLGVVWQDKRDQSLQLTWMGDDLRSQEEVALPNTRREGLAAVTFDGKGSMYYLTVQAGSGADTEVARTATLYKVDERGRQQAAQDLDTSEQGLNLVGFDGDVASLAYMNGKLGLMIGRTMHQSGDGLNHQGGIAVVFDANTMRHEVNHGQTSGHSFESVLTATSDSRFLGIDLGDNYPRGIHLHRFDSLQIHSRVVYTFKTQHGGRARSPDGRSYDRYDEISTGATTYYKWSNDNRTYTELGGVTEGTKGYTVVFAGEKSARGKALDNSRVGSYLNDPRNIGLVQVVKTFETASGSGSEVSDDLVLTRGAPETSGFFTFGGTFSAQRNAGVVWLTDYRDHSTENVSRLKSTKLPDGNILLLWEKWTPDRYVNTYAMRINETGAVLDGPVALGTQVRLNRRDEVLAVGENVYLIDGDKASNMLELVVLQLK